MNRIWRGWSARSARSRWRCRKRIERIKEIQKELIARNNLVNGMVYLEVTRGADTGRDFVFPKESVKPTLVMFTSVKDIVNAPSAKTGIAVITVPDIRWERRDIKSVALLAQVLAKQAAAEAGAAEAWMIEDGKVTEGGSSSAFILTQDDVLVTRQNSSAILPGCTRKAVVALAEERQLRVEERPFSVAGSAGGEGSLHHQRQPVRAGGGHHRRQDGRRRQARSDDQSPARNLCRFRPRHGGVKTIPRYAAAAALALTGGTARKLMAIRFQALMAPISMVRLTVSASENCARTSS